MTRHEFDVFLRADCDPGEIKKATPKGGQKKHALLRRKQGVLVTSNRGVINYATDEQDMA